MHGDAVRVRLGQRDGAQRRVGLGVADDDVGAAHAAEIPAAERLGERHVLKDDAVGHGDDLRPVGELGDVEHPELGAAERRDVGPVARGIVEDVVPDQVRRQVDPREDLAVVRRLGVEFDEGQALVPERLASLGLVEHERRLLRLGGGAADGERGDEGGGGGDAFHGWSPSGW